jgi:hypothetical protein
MMTFDDRKSKVRILTLALLGFLLSVKSDRYFPLPENLPEPVFQTLLIPYTVLFFAAVIIFLKPGIPGETVAFLDRISTIKLTTVIILIFEAMTLILLKVQDIRYTSFGYHLNISLSVLLFTIIGIALIFLLFRDATSDHLFFVALAAYAGTYLLSIVSFPLNSQRSDMLPLIVSGCQSFLAGVTPYGYHSIPHYLIFTYLPGMWIAYLPAVASGADPRFINLICIVISVLILAYTIRDSQKCTVLMIPIFLLTPYLQYRHEIYLGVLFLVLSIIFLLCIQNRWLMSSVASGYALATYQFTWILFPFGILAAFRKWGLKKAIISFLTAITISLAIILPFFLNSPESFINGIYGHWLYVDIPSVNLSYLISLVVPWDFMIFIQGAALAIIFAVALGKMDPEDCWGWVAAALLVFIALNRVIEVYFYLIVLFLLVMHGISKDTPSETPD